MDNKQVNSNVEWSLGPNDYINQYELEQYTTDLVHKQVISALGKINQPSFQERKK